MENINSFLELDGTELGNKLEVLLQTVALEEPENAPSSLNDISIDNSTYKSIEVGETDLYRIYDFEDAEAGSGELAIFYDNEVVTVYDEYSGSFHLDGETVELAWNKLVELHCREAGDSDD